YVTRTSVLLLPVILCLFFFQAEDGIRDDLVTGVQTCALPIFRRRRPALAAQAVQVAGRVGTLEVDGRGEPAPLHGERANRRLDCAARAERVAVVALGAADAEPVGVLPEDLLDRRRLRRVVERRRGPVGVDVAHLAGCDAGID